MAQNPKKHVEMTEGTLNAFIDASLRQTIGFGTSDEISGARAEALKAYLNMPLDGDGDLDGRSKAQDSSVHDTIEAFLPALLAPFISTDALCEFLPKEQGDKEEAGAQTKYVNHIIKSDNDAVTILYTFAKDGLLQKNGFIYADWCETEKTRRTSVRVDYVAMTKIVQNPDYEVISVAVFDGEGNQIEENQAEALLAQDVPLTFEVDFRFTEKLGRVKIRNIPPEYCLISNDAVDIESSKIVGWQEQVTISQLREEGYDEDKIKQIQSTNDDSQDDWQGERSVRTQAQGGIINNSANEVVSDPASRTVWRTVIWTKVDFDGDGKAELRKIIRAGKTTNGGVILSNEEADYKPIVTWTPIIMPHQFFGRSLADQASQVQEMKTALLRAAMNGVYDTVEPRWKINTQAAGEDAYTDLMMRVAGGAVRMDDLDAIQRLNDTPDLSATYQMLEVFDRIAEKRTPVTRQMQAVDADILNNTSATQARIQQNASSQRQELVLRLFAEAVAKLCRLVLKLTIKYQDKPRMLRLMPDMPPIEIDPRFWDADMDVSIKVGLGTGTKEQQMQSLMLINNIQMQDMQMGLPTVDPEKLYNTRAQLINFAGLSQPELYFNDPKEGEGMPQQQDPMAQQQEAQQVEQAIQQAHQAGIQQGKDEVKVMEIESKERMHAMDKQIQEAELRMRSAENQAQAAGYNV